MSSLHPNKPDYLYTIPELAVYPDIRMIIQKDISHLSRNNNCLRCRFFFFECPFLTMIETWIFQTELHPNTKGKLNVINY